MAIKFPIPLLQQNGLRPSFVFNTYLVALYYLYIPWALFIGYWVKPFIGIPLIITLGCIPWYLFHNANEKIIKGTKQQEQIIFCVIAIWVILSGIGGFVWQNRWDHMFRNAIFNDLVFLDWPVYLENDILTYYIGYWLPAALLGKLAHSIEIGMASQLIYGFIGLLLAFRLMTQLIGNVKLKYLLPFIFFSGVDILGLVLTHAPIRHDFHIELWSKLAWYESNSTLIFWVYNQAIPSWVATMLILTIGKKYKSCAIILCFLSISSPFSVIGLLPLAVYYTFSHWNVSKSLSQNMRVLFSMQNVAAVLGVIPVLLYLMLNKSSQIEIGFGCMSIKEYSYSLFLLLILEIGVWMPFIFRRIKNNIAFYLLLVTCMAIFIKAGDSLDFSSRVELPLIFFMTLQIAIYLNKWNTLSKLNKRIFIFVFVCSAITPTFEILRSVYATIVMPVKSYRSDMYKSSFELDILRNNFIADSMLNSDIRPIEMEIFSWPNQKCK